MAVPGVTLSSETSPAVAIWPLGLGGCLLLFTALLFLLGLALPGFPMGHCAQDFAAILNGAYRVLQGQVPHVDFSVPTGSLILFQGVVALKLSPLMPAFYAFQLTIWLLLAPLVWRLALRQPGTALKALVIGAVGVLALVPYVIVYEPIPEFNYNAVYNRAASAVVFLAFVWAASPKRRGLEDILIVGGMVLLALMWKISHTVVLIGFLASVSLVSGIARWVVARALLLVAGVLLALDLASGGMIRGYVADVGVMLSINRGGAVGQMLFLAIRCLLLVLPLLVLLVLLMPQGRRLTQMLRHPGAWLRAWRPALLVSVYAAALLASESQGEGNVAFFGLLALPVLLVRLPAKMKARSGHVALVVVLIAAYPMVEGSLRRGVTLLLRQVPTYRVEPALEPVIGRVLVSARNDETARAYAALWQSSPATLEDYRQFQRDFSAGTNPLEAGQGLSWARGVVEMVEAAQRSGRLQPDTRVATIGFVEPFARALGVKSARGTKLWMDPGRTIGAVSLEAAQRYLADADVVFVQLCPLREVLADLKTRPFGRVLGSEFSKITTTPCYEMWGRKPR